MVYCTGKYYNDGYYVNVSIITVVSSESKVYPCTIYSKGGMAMETLHSISNAKILSFLVEIRGYILDLLSVVSIF